jgi:T-complex protein 1 subunit eta
VAVRWSRIDGYPFGASSQTRSYGVNIEESGITNTLDLGVWEPSDNKMHSFESVTVAACVILSIDETVISQPSQDPSMYVF